jgi:hypothetical protein
VLTSIASTAMNLPIAVRQIKRKSITHEIVIATSLQGAVGIAALIGQRWFLALV